MMGGILWYYYDFADFIKSGFSESYQYKSGTPGFPVWGYGFILCFLKAGHSLSYYNKLLT